MDWRSACAAVIPCFNEEEEIAGIVAGVRIHVPAVFVIDDGSTDATAAKASTAGAIVCQGPANSGKGAALQTGCAQARDRGFGWALTLDGDGQHSPEDTPKFFACAEQTSASLVIGNRMDQAAQMPPLRRWVNRAMSWQISKIIDLPTPDSQCGFRLLNLKDWARLPISTDHFEIESEMLFQFAQAGLGIRFVPIKVIYKHERSKIQPWRDTLRWLHWFRRARGLARRSKP